MEQNNSPRTSSAFAKLNCTETPGSDALGLFPTYYCMKCEHGYFTELRESTYTHRALECTNCGQLQDVPVNHIIHLVTTGGALPESINGFNKRVGEHMDKVQSTITQKLEENFKQLKELADTIIPRPTVGRIIHIFPGERWELPKHATRLAAIVTFVNQDDLVIDCTAFQPTGPHKITGPAPISLGYVPHVSLLRDPAEPYWDWPERS